MLSALAGLVGVTLAVVFGQLGAALRRARAAELPGRGSRALVKIESAAEDAFVGELSEANLWIGASDVFVDNVFVWSDGTPITFGNWGPSQPDGFPGPDCVEKRREAGERWYDQPCADAKLSVCEAPAR